MVLMRRKAWNTLVQRKGHQLRATLSDLSFLVRKRKAV